MDVDLPREPPRRRSKHDLAFIRKQECLLCHKTPTDWHDLEFPNHIRWHAIAASSPCSFGVSSRMSASTWKAPFGDHPLSLQRPSRRRKMSRSSLSSRSR